MRRRKHVPEQSFIPKYDTEISGHGRPKLVRDFYFIFYPHEPTMKRRKKRAKKPLKTVELCNMELVNLGMLKFVSIGMTYE